jgi:hypothetical protein
MLSVATDEQAQPELRLDLDELAREVPAGCWPRPWRLRWTPTWPPTPTRSTSAAGGWWSATAHAPARTWAMGAGAVQVRRPRVDDRRVDPATGERVQYLSAILPRWVRRSPKVAEVLAAAVPARAVHRRLRPRAGRVLRVRRRAVGLDHRAAGRAVAGRACRLHPAGPVRPGLRVLLGRRHPLHPAPDRRPVVRPGHRRCPGRRDQGTGRGHRGHP